MQNLTEQQIKDFVGEELPTSTREAITFCLQQLYADKTHGLTDQVVPGLTYMELIAALQMAQVWVEQDLQWDAEEENCSDL